MQTLSGTLTAAQKASTLVPYVKVETRDESARVKILSWARWYSGSEGDQPHACCVAGDGSLVRARATGGTLYVARVAGPTAGSTYSSWSSLTTGIHASSPVALCSIGALVVVFYVNAAGTGLVYKVSTDNGANWSTEGSAGTAGGTITRLAAAYKDASRLAVFLVVGATVYSVQVDGTWGAITAWSNSAKTVTGLAAFYSGDYNLVVTGTNSDDDYHVWSTIFGDGYSYAAGSWGPLNDVMVASAGAGVEYHEPAVGFPDVYRLWYREKYTGTVAYNRPYWSHGIRGAADYVSNIWREPVPFDLSTTVGVAVGYSATQVFLTTPAGVWRAGLGSTATAMTDHVLELDLREGLSGGCWVVVRNDDGRYNAGGASVGALGKGYQLEVSLGARSSAGNETGSGRHFWIQGWKRVFRGGRAVVVVEAVDAWGLLELWRARRHLTWAAGSMTRFQLLQAVLGFVGLELSSVGDLSDEMDVDQPAFAISPGESGRTAARRLLEQVPEVLYWRQATGYVKQVAAGDSSSYTLGTDHAVTASEASEEVYDVNRVQIFGSGVYGEELAWSELVGGGDYLRQVRDANLTTTAQVNGRAAADKRRWELAATPAVIVGPVHCGVEVYDVVTVTAAQVGLSAVKRRVRGLRVRYKRTRESVWEMELALGGA